MTIEMKDYMVHFSVYLNTEEQQHSDRKYTNMQSLVNYYQNTQWNI